MRYVVLATGFDGTLARDGRCDERSLAMLRALSASGRKLILVTSRELRDLLDVFPEARLFDYLVVENGAVVHRPDTRESAILAHAPPETLIHELRRLQIAPLSVGSAIITTDGSHRAALVEALRKLHLECDLLENDRRLAVLPTGVNKATGLAAVLEEIGMSEHNLIAVGDAENDLALFQLAEHSVAVGNAAPDLKRAADRVTRAAYADGVLEFAQELLANESATTPLRRRIVLGARSAQHEVALPPARGSILMTGPNASGKAALCNKVLSQYLAQRYQCCVIGAYARPNSQDDVTLMSFGDPQNVPRPASVLAALEHPGQSVLVNVVAIDPSERAGFIEALITDLISLQTRAGRPHAIVFDQAEIVLNDATLEMMKQFDAAMTVYVTAQPNNLPRGLLRTIDVVVALGDASVTLNCFRQLDTPGQTQAEFFPLEPGQALLWMRESGTSPFKMAVDLRPAAVVVIPENSLGTSSGARARSALAHSGEAAVP